MSEIVKELRALHDRLNCNVVAGRIKNETVYQADCEAAMKKLWEAADHIEALEGFMREGAG